MSVLNIKQQYNIYGLKNFNLIYLCKSSAFLIPLLFMFVFYDYNIETTLRVRTIKQDVWLPLPRVIIHKVTLQFARKFQNIYILFHYDTISVPYIQNIKSHGCTNTKRQKNVDYNCKRNLWLRLLRLDTLSIVYDLYFICAAARHLCAVFFFTCSVIPH